MKKYFAFIVAACCCPGFLQAQQIAVNQTVYFNSGSFVINCATLPTLRKLRDSIQQITGAHIALEGNTDNTGSRKSNEILSVKRALAVKKYLASGDTKNIYTTKYFGEKKPLANNRSLHGKQLNRRVDIIITGSEKNTADEENTSAEIGALYEKIQKSFQEFCIDISRDTILTSAQGTLIYIRANSITVTEGCKNNCVRFRVKEDYLKSDMIADELSTTSSPLPAAFLTTSPGRMLETQGMIYTEAVDCNNSLLKLENPLTILMPADTVREDVAIFDGKRNHDGVMNWLLNNNTKLKNINLADIDFCGYALDDVAFSSACGPCKFLFCRVKRLPKAFKGTFNKNTRSQNKSFRTCIAGLKKKAGTNFSASAKLITPLKPVPAPRFNCEDLAKLFKTYGVNNFDALALAMNKPLLDSFKVQTMAQLLDTMKKINRQNIETAILNKNVSFEDFKYYVFNSSDFGWKNIDCFSNIPKDRLTPMSINLKPSAGVDCKLIFKERRSVLPATREANEFEFSGVPFGEKAVVLAIKYEAGKIFLAMQPITIGGRSIDVDLQEISAAALKERLKELDR